MAKRDYIGRTLHRWSGLLSRSKNKTMNNLGKIMMPLPKDADKKFRNPMLEIYDAYYEARQYDHLYPWDETEASDGSYIPIRKRCPRIQYRFAATFSKRITSKLLGGRLFPTIKVEDDPDTTEFLRYVIKASEIKSLLLEPVRRMINSGSVFVRFYVVNGKYRIEHYLSKYCYPLFDPAGDLETMVVRYLYESKNETDEKGNPKLKWYQIEFGKYSDILYNNPDYNENESPQFNVASETKHDLGFVQGEWFRTAEIKGSDDGISLIADITDFIDELNFSISQSSQVVSYNQDPQLIVTKMNEDELGELIRSSTKAWNMGREGEAKFLETNLNGVTVAGDLREKVLKGIQDISRIVFLDPEKIVGNAQSAKAMEVLHGPMLELIEELRPTIEKHLVSIITKMALANLILIHRGIPAPVEIPQGYAPQSFNITASWSPVFPLTLEDLQKKVSIITTATSGNIISRETGLEYIANDFGVEDIELEKKKIEDQPILSPFGPF